MTSSKAIICTFCSTPTSECLRDEKSYDFEMYNMFWEINKNKPVKNSLQLRSKRIPFYFVVALCENWGKRQRKMTCSWWCCVMFAVECANTHVLARWEVRPCDAPAKKSCCTLTIGQGLTSVRAVAMHAKAWYTLHCTCSKHTKLH